MVKPFELIRKAKDKLTNSETPQLDAEVLLSHTMKWDRMQLFLNRDAEIPEDREMLFWSLINRRSDGEPIAYITGVREFMGLPFEVGPGVLIPRPDTEILVEAILELTDHEQFDRSAGKRGDCIFSDGWSLQERLVIVDIGCGSGAIAVSLASLIQDSQLYALDLMEQPLLLTQQNAVQNHVSSRLEVVKSDLLSELDGKLMGNIDVLVSNPPYIDQNEYAELMRDVKAFEPKSALTDHADGLEFYRRITQQAPLWLKHGGMLAFEIGYNQASAVLALMEAQGFSKLECRKDLAGKDRVVLGFALQNT